MKKRNKKKRQPKTSKGAVGYHNHRGIWRLCWWCPIQSRRRYASTGSKVSDGLIAENRARSIAHLITNDLMSGNYDPTLVKYFPSRQRTKAQAVLTVEGLISQWLDYKKSRVCDRTLTKYSTTLKHLQQGNANLLRIPAKQIGEGQAEDFSIYVKGLGIGPDQRRRHLETLKAIWEWGIRRRLVEENPWFESYKAVNVPPTPMPKPFSREEIGAIIAGARSDERFKHYADFIEFLFASGCRIGEAAGLRGTHVSKDGWIVWIGEIVSRGLRRPGKCYKARQVRLTPKLQEIISERTKQLRKSDDLVFTSKRGRSIRDENFRFRVWVPLLAQLEINYRSPKYTRHSLVSNALELGISPVVISQLTGHSTRVLYENYTGLIGSSPELPEVF